MSDQYVQKFPFLREGRLRKRFKISGRQWRKMQRTARETKVENIAVTFTRLWEHLEGGARAPRRRCPMIPRHYQGVENHIPNKVVASFAAGVLLVLGALVLVLGVIL